MFRELTEELRNELREGIFDKIVNKFNKKPSLKAEPDFVAPQPEFPKNKKSIPTSSEFKSQVPNLFDLDDLYGLPEFGTEPTQAHAKTKYDPKYDAHLKTRAHIVQPIKSVGHNVTKVINMPPKSTQNSDDDELPKPSFKN